MVSATQLLTWLAVVLSVTAGGHYYLWRRLVRDPAWPKPVSNWLTWALVALMLSQPAIFLVARGGSREVIHWPALVAFTWMGFLSTFFTLLLLSDIALLVGRSFRGTKAPADPERRQLMQRAVAGGIALGGTGFVGASVARALGAFQVSSVEVRLAKLPRSFDGFRIAQVSDIHVGPTIGRDFIEAMVARVNGLGANLVAITGDLVDGSVKNLSRHTEPLGDLRASDGVYFVTGNHEYYSGHEDWIAELARLGIPTLRNSRVELQRENDVVDLAGVTDHRAAPFGDAPDFERALRGRDVSRELLLLAHQPAAVHEAQKHDVGLQLSGHTHGGQFWPWNLVVGFIQPISRGLGAFGRTQVYVNTGTGYWGPPLRMGTDPEITLITLRSGAA